MSKFGKLSERELDIAEFALRRGLSVLVMTYKLTNRDCADICDLVLQDENFRERLREQLESAK